MDSRFSAILTTGGYETNIGTNVVDWPVEPFTDEELPVLTYKDVTVETEVESFVGFANRMTVIITAAVTSTTPMAQIRKIIADVDKAIGIDQTWGGLALMTERVGDESEATIQEKKFTGCSITVVVTFRNIAWNDYTQV
jgi:hypothetical protein